jgi:hypothetical protein
MSTDFQQLFFFLSTEDEIDGVRVLQKLFRMLRVYSLRTFAMKEKQAGVIYRPSWSS